MRKHVAIVLTLLVGLGLGTVLHGQDAAQPAAKTLDSPYTPTFEEWADAWLRAYWVNYSNGGLFDVRLEDPNIKTVDARGNRHWQIVVGPHKNLGPAAKYKEFTDALQPCIAQLKAWEAAGWPIDADNCINYNDGSYDSDISSIKPSTTNNPRRGR